MSQAATRLRTSEASRLQCARAQLGLSYWSAVCLLVLWSGTLAFYGLDAGFLYRTEALRALVGRNMLQSGDYLVPQLYGEPLLTKGPVMYAAIAAASWPFGEVTTWSARIPAALAMVFTVLLVYWHLLRYTEEGGRSGKVTLSRVAAFLIACMIACNPLWLDKATSAEIDMVVVFWVTLALVCFFRAVEGNYRLRGAAWHELEQIGCADGIGNPEWASRQGANRWLAGLGWWLLAMLAVALGTLTKWHAWVFFYATVLVYLFWTRQMRQLLSSGHLLGLATAMVVLGGWFLLVAHRVGWTMLWETLWQQALPRLSPAHQRGERVWIEALLHPAKMLICGLPWSAFFWLTLWRPWYRSLTARGLALLRTLHCWTWPSLLIFTLLPDHDSRHSMPLVTGWLTLGAMGCWLALAPPMDGAVRRFGRLGLLTVLGGFGLAVVVGEALAWRRLPIERFGLAVMLGGAAIFVLSAGWRAYRKSRWFGVVMSLLLTWLVAKIAFAELVVPVRSIRDPMGKASLLKQHIPPDETLYIFQAKDEGIMFYYEGKVLRVRGWEHLPHRNQVYCLVTPRDFGRLEQTQRWQVVWQRPFLDEQGDPMTLVLLQARRPLPEMSMPDG